MNSFIIDCAAITDHDSRVIDSESAAVRAAQSAEINWADSIP